LTSKTFAEGRARARDTARCTGPPLLFGFRLWASVCLALYVAFWLQLDNAFWAGTSAALMCQPRLGASLRKGWFRMIGTLVGAIAIVALTACFPQDRVPFLLGLALWGAACAAAATLLRNFAAYAAALAGYTAAIIAYDQLGATGGPSGDAFMLAITRTTEISIGIVSAGLVLAASDFGGAKRRLAALFAALSAEIVGGFLGSFELFGAEQREMQPVRRELIKRVIALDPIVDEAIGESSELRARSPVLQGAIDGLLGALASWRIVAVHLEGVSDHPSRNELLRNIPLELRAASRPGPSSQWLRNPVRLRRLCEAAAGNLSALPARTPSLRLLADQTAGVLAGFSRALDGLALLLGDRARPLGRRRTGPVVADWLPSLVNAGRAFIAIAVVAGFWIATAWPGGALAMTWTAIPVILFAPRAGEAYGASVGFMVGNTLAAAFAAVLAFAVLPGLSTFPGFAVAMGLYLVPVGALLAQSSFTHSRHVSIFAAMAGNLVPVLGPANLMSYDTAHFYNTALAILAGNGAAALSFRLVPPLTSRFRTRRLLMLALRDVRAIASARRVENPEELEQRMYARLWALPEEAEPLQRGRLLAALSVGAEILRLRRACAQLGLTPELDRALAALAEGRSTAETGLVQLDRLAAARDGGPESSSVVLRARSSVLTIVEAITQHPSYFGAGAAA